MKKIFSSTHHTLFILLYLLSYSLLFSIIITTTLIFRPFSYVDNDHSYLTCNVDNKQYETSPNYIFFITDKLDPFNDAKARKLCQYRVINDYNNTYQTPGQVNYSLQPAFKSDTNWLNVIFIGGLIFFVGTICIEKIWVLIFGNQNSFGKHLWSLIINFNADKRVTKHKFSFYLLIIAFLSLFIYLLYFKDFSIRSFCNNKMNAQLFNYHLSINQNNAPEATKEFIQVKEAIKQVYIQCLKENGL